MTGSFYLPLRDGGFLASQATRGPWAATHQHGSPPIALMVRAAEALVPEARPLRWTVDLARPVPIGRVDVRAAVVRSGRRTSLVAAELIADGRSCFSARILMVVPVADAPPATAGVPETREGVPFQFPFFPWPEGFHTAVEARRIAGEPGCGDLAVWLRLRVALVDGEVATPSQRVAALTDAGSGVGWGLDTQVWTFLNADLDQHILRAPRGEWLGLHARTRRAADGVGLARTEVFDADGVIGDAQQGLVLARVVTA